MRFRTAIQSLRFTCLLVLLVAGLACADDGQDKNKSLELFEKHVRPAFLDQCIRCHGPKKQQGGLRLDSREWLIKGGDSGPVVTAGDPSDSILINAIRYGDPALEMPPRGKLPDATIEAFEHWVSLGAADPRVGAASEQATTSPSIEEGRSFWSFQRIRNPEPPKVNDSNWPLTAIDQFILARLEQKQITPNADAQRVTLLRRMYYDLIGLPPTPEQINSFLNDESPGAYETLIDQLLDSPQFGERWGRHWLDVVRFAESSGGGRTLLFPNAWRYRDYVIDSFNHDVPYDLFLKEQIAGDLLLHGDWQDKRRKLTATAFLLLGPTNYELQDKDILEMDVVDEQLDTIGKSMLGMTIGCARCHDHKFDPIPTEDYYALAGILRSTKAMIHSNVSTWNKVELPLPPDQESVVQQQEQKLAAMRTLIEGSKKELVALGGMPKTNKPKGVANIDASTVEGIVVDDESAELVGQWVSSTSVPRYVNGKYIHDATADKGKKQVIFRPMLTEAGNYEVRIGYSPSGNRSANVPVHVHHAAGETVTRIDQKATPEIDDAFTSVGVYAFDPDQEIKIVVSNEGTEDGVVIADSVVLVKSDLTALPTQEQVDIAENIPFIIQNPRALEGIVVDDTEAKLVGQWEHSVHTPPFVGAGYIHDDKEQKGMKSATFEPDLPRDGIYEVRVAHNTNIRRANNVPITVHHADGETTIEIDEGEEAPIGKLFRSVGKFRFKKGRLGHVTISTEGTDDKYVIVDAIQFIAVDDDPTMKEKKRKALAKEIKSLEVELKQAEKTGPQRPIAMVTGDDSDAGDIHLAIRGVVHNRGPIVKRGVMQVAASDARPTIAEGESGRRELADWIANPGNPLTARVMSNRIWHWLMGRGIVSSVDNFGSMGTAPTHPELLDHLATSFVENGWSVKKLIREIMLSRTYQLSTDDSASSMMVDPDNQLLWRMNRKRLHAEDIRDTLLFVAGTLDEQAGGANVRPGTNSEYGYKFRSKRRSVYVPVFRNTLPEIFEVFDFADPNIQRGSRTSSTIASQALLLMNHPLVIDQSKLAAKRLLESRPISNSAAIEQVYLQVLGRKPSSKEIEIAVDFIEHPDNEVASDIADDNTHLRWSLLIQALFQCVDFRYLN